MQNEWHEMQANSVINARGDSAPPVYTLAGLTDKEMPNKDYEFIALKVEGLCIGGQGCGRQRGYGWLLLMRNTPGAEKQRFKWFQETVLKEFLVWIRNEYFAFDADEVGANITEELRAVFWMDGDSSQLASMTSEEGIRWFHENGVIACKHNAAGTGKEQAADLGNCFRISKSVNKRTTNKDIDVENHLLKRRMTEQLKYMSTKNMFRHQKHAAIVDHLSKQPIVLAKSSLLDNVISGWKANGIIDSKFHKYPNLHKMIATCKKIPKPSDYALYFSAFDALLRYTVDNDNQHIPDEVFMSHGFPADIDAYGETFIRGATVTQENQQRAKILTSEAEIRKRSQRDMAVELVHQQKADLAKCRADNLVSGELAIIKMVCTNAGMEATEDNVKQCTIEHFSTLKKDELITFILARSEKYTEKRQVKHLLHPNPKKALYDAALNIENALSVAFEARNNSSRVLALASEGNETNDESNAAKDRWISPTVITVQLRPEHDGIVKPSVILSDKVKFDFIRSTFDPNSKTLMNSISFPLPEEVLLKADCLYSILASRLRSHTQTRVIPAQRKNKCLNWARKNLALVAAYMIIADHIITDISCIDESSCIIKPPMSNSFLLCANEELAHLGCYLHYDTNKYVWIRSGSAAGAGGFGQRLDQHTKRAESNSNPDNSQFYDNYPSMKSVRSTSRGKRGMFEHLNPYIGASFTNIPPEVVKCLLIHDNDDADWISNLKLNGKQLNEKYHQMIAYLFELGYDLAISRIHNVSNSPGFEGCGLILDKKSDK